VYKSLESLEITVLSDDLLSELVTLLGPLDVAGFQLQNPNQQGSIDGLVLLKHYQTLYNRLKIFRSMSTQNQIGLSLALEMEILVEGLLTDGEVFKSMGYEKLYKRGFLDYELWKKFQQQKKKRDIQALDDAFCTVDDLENPTPLQSSNSIHSESPFPQFEVDPVENFPNSDSELREMSQFSTSDNLIRLKTLENLPFFKEANHCPEPGHKIGANLVSGDVDNSVNNLKIGRPPLANFDKLNPFSTSLYGAAERGDESIVKILLSCGVDVNQGCSWGGDDTPLAVAAKNGHEAVARLLLDRGADVNKGLFYNAPLAAAAREGHERLERLLLDHGADVNNSSLYVDTPLAAAARGGHEEVVQLLLDRGADVNNSSLYGDTPLAAAAVNSHGKVVQLLINRGADKDYSVFCAAQTKNREGMDLLLQLGANRELALVGAARAGLEVVVRELLMDGVDADAITPRGTALSAAAAAGCNDSTVNILLQQGVDVHTALCILQGNGDMNSAGKLLKMASHPRDSGVTAQKLRSLRLQFVHQYTLMLSAGLCSSTKCRNLACCFRNYRDAWAAGIRAMRRLCNGSLPETFHSTISFLCLARAIVENLDNSGHGAYLEDFILDLNRWQELFRSNAEDLAAYKEVVNSMWGVVLDHTEVVYAEALISFQQLASTLVKQANESFGLEIFENEGFERSQRRYLERNSLNPSTRDQPTNTGDGRFFEVGSIQQPEPGPLWPTDPPLSSNIIPLKERIKDDMSSPVVEPMVILLMAGAVFAIVIIFFQGQFTTFPSRKF